MPAASRAPNNIKANWDINPAFGGPILRDKLWFFGAARYNVNVRLRRGALLEPQRQQSERLDLRTRYQSPGLERTEAAGHAARVSWQATPRHKLGFITYNTTYCFCPTDASLTRAWEAGQRADYPNQRLLAGDWTFPPTNRLLVEGSGANLQVGEQPIALGRPGRGDDPRAGAGDRYAVPRGRDLPDPGSERLHLRGAFSYVTGAHAFRVGGPTGAATSASWSTTCRR